MKKFLILALAIVVWASASAQVVGAKLQASGLTCSMCNLSIKRSLENLDFVKEIKPNVELALYEITFKDSAKVSFAAIQKAVSDAGFSVAKLTFEFQFNDSNNLDNNQFEFSGNKFSVIEGNLLGGETLCQLQIIDKGFVSEKVYKKYKNKIGTDTNSIHLIKI
jgi:copper chaperone CopZ